MVPTETSTSFNDTASDTTTSSFPRLSASGSTFIGTIKPAVGGTVDRDYFMIDVGDGFRDGPGSLSTSPLRMTVQLSGSFPPGDTGTFAVEWGQITYKTLDFNGAVGQAGSRLLFNSFSSGTVELHPNWWKPNVGGEPFVLYFSVSPAGYTGPYTITLSDGTGGGGGGGSRPDFTAQAEGLSATTVSPGGSVYVNGRVANAGTAAGAPGRIGYYLSSDAAITTSDTFLGYIDQAAALSVGGSIGLSTQVTLPTNIQAGTAYLGFIADYNTQTAETNEANNASSGIAFTVAGNTASGPDFVVSEVSLDKTSVVPGARVTASFTITNQGTVASGKAGGYVILSHDMVFGGFTAASDSDRGLGGSHVIGSNATLAAGASASTNHVFTIPTDVLPGNYYVGLVTDFANRVSESNEGNNTVWLPITIGPASRPNDFNGDAKSDILWRNDSGALNVWSSTGTGFTGRDFGIVPTSWTVADTADFGGDGKADILWRNADGRVNIWTSGDTTFATRDLGVVPSAWKIQGADDVSGDGKADLLWRHDDGSLNVWIGTGTSFTSQDFGKLALGWTLQETGDVNADGKADLFWRHDDGTLNVWTSTGSSFASNGFGVVPTSWHIADVADVNGDARADIVWRNDSGALNVWTSTGTGFAGNDFGIVGNDWTLERAQDVGGDGRADILWRNDNGTLNVWTSTGTGFTGHDHGVIDPSWHIV